ncbi:MAG: HAD family hydrolase [Chloroflexi bacterium]|nr:HAD family hydrolase [Chloroflexota bacterium]
MRAVDAIVFDFDGLIVDTETPAFLSWAEIYRELGATLTTEEWAVCLGTVSSAFDVFADLQRKLGHPVDAEALTRERQRRKEALSAQQEALPGVRDYLRDARLQGLAIGLASSSPHGWVERHLKRLGLLDYFDCLLCAEDVEHVKPHPALYAQAVAALGMAPHAAVALEDSPNGIVAAKAAGLRCVAVPGPLSQHLPLGGADLRISSLADVSLDTLLRRLATVAA